ncbi:protocadherin gamma-B5-like isoform X5 [Rana temporaria]|uniref:protocadherin gamma-B5-like isoform X5 n=1 Tax=Rana temporaria TaxID=8407 RepID=UPI001AAD4C31|nr:protocadherin gamma-B5-like isoform X5 [Rana temporaria]
MLKMDEMKHHSQAYKGIAWQVIFSFLFSWLCHSVSGQIHYSIVEEMRKDSVIANIAKDLGLDIKQLSSRNLQMISHISDKYLYVNVDNGNLYVKDRIDREALCGAAPTCFLSFDAVVENPFNIFKVRIEIQDINDNPPVFYSETFTIETIESTSSGTIFALQSAEDLDIGVNSVQTYKLSDNSHFTLNQKISSDGFQSLELVLEKSLDQELQNVHKLILTALDGGNPVRSGTAVIQIIVIDVNDNFPIFSQKVYKVSVSENSAVNTTIINVNATDRDAGTNGQITYSFSKTSGNVHPSGFFSIHSKSGDININQKLDFEETMNYELSVQAKDGGGLVSHCKVLIEVIDENDNAPEIFITSFSPIPENSTSGKMIALIRVHDKDSGENGEVECKLTEEMPFNLVLSSSSVYTIVTTGPMDREKVSNYNITIVATDRGSPPLSSQKSIKLEILDVNDNPPLFMQSTYVGYVPENNLPGASIYTIKAYDLDIADNAKITYSISSKKTEDLHMTSYVSLNIETGVIYAQRSFDYEQHKEFIIEVTAKDNGHPSLSSNTTITIKVIDQNDNAPKLLYPSPESGASAGFEMVSFGAEPGSMITKVVAVDADSGHNAWLSYHFAQVADPSYFTIDEHTGEIRTQHVFQEKDTLNHKVVVMVRDNGIPSLSATVTITLVVADSFQQLVPKFVNRFPDEDSQSNFQLYLVIALAVISLLFIITVLLTVISKCRKSKPFPVYGPVSSNLYPQVDPRMLSQYTSGTLTLPYSYNVCVALDSGESDFTYMKTNQNVPVDNLIDADDSGLGHESLREALPTNGQNQHSQPNADWQLTQGQRPGPSGTQQPTEEPGVWPNNQFETERLQAMILASANEAAEGSSGLGGSTGTMGLSARYGPQFTLQHVPDYRQNIYIPGTTSTLTNAAGKRDNKAPSGNKKKSGKKEKK